MIKLKNLKIDEQENIICDAYPESAKEPGKIVVSKEEMIDFSLPQGYEWCEYHIRHAERYIIDNYNDLISKIRNNEIKTGLLIMWC